MNLSSGHAADLSYKVKTGGKIMDKTETLALTLARNVPGN